MLIAPPAPAIALNNQKVAFLYSKFSELLSYMKLLISSNFTADFLARFLDKKLPCELLMQIIISMQLILDQHSEVYKGGFDVVILFLDFAILYRSMTMRDLKAHIEALVFFC